MKKRQKVGLSIAGQLAEKNKIKKAKYAISINLEVGKKIDVICENFGIKSEDYLSAIIESIAIGNGVISREYRQSLNANNADDKDKLNE